jgi:ribosome-binding protein aMBF1 (putative translation factor)
MNNQEKQGLAQKLQNTKELIQALEELEYEENNQEAGNISHLLKIMTDMFEEVDQRLKALEKKQDAN